jgi:fatty-acyl-CoA synthase
VTGPTPSLWARLERSGSRDDMLLAWEGGAYVGWSWREWHDRALAFAGGLRRAGVRPGDRVGHLLENSRDACAAVLGTWLAGCSVVSMPLIARGMAPPAYAAQLRRIVAESEPAVVVAGAGLEPLLASAALGVPMLATAAMDGPPLRDPEPPASGDPAFVQYSSGSTTEPKGCELSAAAIAWQLDASARALEVDPERDTSVMWLPISHDMGLFGAVLLSYWTGHRLVLGTPQRFLTRPGSWFEDCARFAGTIAATPAFGLDLAVRMARHRPPPAFPMRCMVVGGDRVEPGVLERAAQTLGESVPASALMPAYGLAEAVLTVAITPLGRGPLLEADPEGRAMTSAGRALPGVELEVTGGSRVGEIVVRSPSLANGYLGRPELTAARFTDRGLRTGDHGLLRDGELFVVGREDDLMSVAGRNVYARDIELALAGLPGVRPGGCAVVDLPAGAAPRLVAVLEPRDTGGDLRTLARHISSASVEAVGVGIDECVFLPRGSFPKTPSGKLQRHRCRAIASGHEFDRIRPRRPGAVHVRG